jgi:hypothetical protein
MGGETVRCHRVRDAGAAVVQFLENQAGVEGAEPGAAQLLRYGEVHEPELPRLPHHVVGEGLFLVVLRRDRNDLVGGEATRGLLQLLLLGGELELHHASC